MKRHEKVPMSEKTQKGEKKAPPPKWFGKKPGKSILPESRFCTFSSTHPFARTWCVCVCVYVFVSIFILVICSHFVWCLSLFASQKVVIKQSGHYDTWSADQSEPESNISVHDRNALSIKNIFY